MEIKWSDGMKNRSRTPHLFVRATGEDWVQFDGQPIPGLVAVKSSKYTKNGKWSNTAYTLAVADTATVVEVCQPFDYFGNTWADHAAAISVLAGTCDREQAARELLPRINTRSYNDAVARANENEAAIAALVPAPAPLIVTRHAALVEWLAAQGITGEVKAQVTADDVRGRCVIGVLPLHLAAEAAEVVAVDMPGLTLEQRRQINDLTCAEITQAGAKLTTYVVTRK